MFGDFCCTYRAEILHTYWLMFQTNRKIIKSIVSTVLPELQPKMYQKFVICMYFAYTTHLQKCLESSAEPTELKFCTHVG